MRPRREDGEDNTNKHMLISWCVFFQFPFLKGFKGTQQAAYCSNKSKYSKLKKH